MRSVRILSLLLAFPAWAQTSTPQAIPGLHVDNVMSSTELKNLGDFGATLSGPILKDRVWFFAGIVPSFTRYECRTVGPSPST